MMERDNFLDRPVGDKTERQLLIEAKQIRQSEIKLEIARLTYEYQLLDSEIDKLGS